MDTFPENAKPCPYATWTNLSSPGIKTDQLIISLSSGPTATKQELAARSRRVEKKTSEPPGSEIATWCSAIGKMLPSMVVILRLLSSTTSIPRWIDCLLETKKLTSAGLFMTERTRTRLESCLFFCLSLNYNVIILIWKFLLN